MTPGPSRVSKDDAVSIFEGNEFESTSECDDNDFFELIDISSVLQMVQAHQSSIEFRKLLMKSFQQI